MSINTLCNPDPLESERSGTPTTPYGFEEGSSRPRRTAASATRSYRIPTDSDEDEVSDDIDYSYSAPKRNRSKGKGKGKAAERTPSAQPEAMDLHLWTKHLGLLLKEEEKKVCRRPISSERAGLMVLDSGRNESAWLRGMSSDGPRRGSARYWTCILNRFALTDFNHLD